MPKIESTRDERPAICPLDCADTCSLKVEVEHGRLKKVRGSSTNPFTRGKICAKVATGLQEQVHGPDRLETPLKRFGDRGPMARFEPISWTEAIETIYQNFETSIKAHGPLSIVPMAYGGPMGRLAGGSMDKRFFNALGAQQVNSSPLCAGITDAAYTSLFGDSGGIAQAEFAHSKLIVVWGNNITACNLHLTKIIRDAQKQGAKLVVIDPKKTRIAEHADLHLQLLPGTDVVLAYAVAAELKRLKAVDEHFLNENVIGAEAYFAEAEKYSLEQAAELCDLKLEDVEQFTHFWRDIKPAAMNTGIGAERNRNGGSGIRAALALPVITGNFGPKGAGVCNVSGYFPTNTQALQRNDLISDEQETISILDIPDLILEPEAKKTPIKNLFIYNHNPVAVHPRQGRMIEALLKEDLFIVGCDITLTDSMRYADIVLPAASHLEYSDIYTAYGHSFLQRSEAAIPPVAEALPNTEIFRRLAQRFSLTNSIFADPMFRESDEALIRTAMDSEHSAMVGRAKDSLKVSAPIDCSRDASGRDTPSLFRGLMPSTPSGKVELFSSALEQEYRQGLPTWTALERSHPFILVSPSSEKRTNSTFGNIEGHDSDVLLEINPQDALERSLRDGQAVYVFNQQAELILNLKVSSGVKKGTLYSPKGAWLKHRSHTVNALIPGHKADIAGGACYNDTQVDIRACD